MKNKHATKRTAANGRFVTKPLGKGKAMKFLKVEGMALNGTSTKTISRFESRGLKGDDLRSAITGSFTKKHG